MTQSWWLWPPVLPSLQKCSSTWCFRLKGLSDAYLTQAAGHSETLYVSQALLHVHRNYAGGALHDSFPLGWGVLEAAGPWLSGCSSQDSLHVMKGLGFFSFWPQFSSSLAKIILPKPLTLFVFSLIAFFLVPTSSFLLSTLISTHREWLEYTRSEIPTTGGKACGNKTLA